MRDAVRVDAKFDKITYTSTNIVVREWLHNARLRNSLRANRGHVRTYVSKSKTTVTLLPCLYYRSHLKQVLY
ncbi:hypothetical protein AHF37_09326 [Paragonimus kellicotti]|nr:hypothetical protein AHF37_09326 [Paragonimus kellicotti]